LWAAYELARVQAVTAVRKEACGKLDMDAVQQHIDGIAALVPRLGEIITKAGTVQKSGEFIEDTGASHVLSGRATRPCCVFQTTRRRHCPGSRQPEAKARRAKRPRSTLSAFTHPVKARIGAVCRHGIRKCSRGFPLGRGV
jgi:hypothetical protein